jgi:TP901 family phage tail tape measure protein
MEELASAGFDANGIYGAMPGLLDLAASGNIDLASAAEIAAAAFNGFGLTAPEDIQHVADVIAESAARTNASVDSMGYSFKYVAPYSAALNVSMEETAAAIGILSDAGRHTCPAVKKFAA